MSSSTQATTNNNQLVVAEDKKPVSLLKQFFLDAEELATKQYAKDVRIAEFRRACERHVAKLEAEKAELASQIEQVHGKQETWDSTHRAIFEDCKVQATRMNAYEKKRKAEKKAEGTFTKKAKSSTPTTASASATSPATAITVDTQEMPNTPPAEDVSAESAKAPAK
jgi:hypothetical protein